MAQGAESWEDVDARLQDLSILGTEGATPPSQSGSVTPDDASGAEAPLPAPPPAEQSLEKAVQSVDHALRDALCHPKNRAVVLQLEADVSWFVSNSREPQFVFTGDMSSYERLLAHRVAQHWGLETTIISQGPDQGRILASRSFHTGSPSIKLMDVPVALAESPLYAATSVGPLPQMPSGPGGGAPGATPRVLVRRRPERQTGRHSVEGSSGSHPGANYLQFNSNEDREAVYAQARARIFADSQGGGGSGGGVQQPPPPTQLGGGGGHPGAQSSPRGFSGHGHGGGAFVPLRGGSLDGYLSPRGSVPSPLALAPPHQPPPPPPSQGQPGAGAYGRKAQLRNKQEDMADPDFRRGRFSPRFDQGSYAPEDPNSLYLRPTYSTEFPELGPKPDGTPHVSPSHYQPVYPQGYPGPGMVAMSPYHMYPGQGMVPPGMMAAHIPGGMALYPAGGSMPYAPPGGAAYMPIPQYGYVPIRPGSDPMLAFHAQGMPMYGGGYGGPPMSPAGSRGMGGGPQGLHPVSRRASSDARPGGGHRGGPPGRGRGPGYRGGGAPGSGGAGAPARTGSGGAGSGGGGAAAAAAPGATTSAESTCNNSGSCGADPCVSTAGEGTGEHSPRDERASFESTGTQANSPREGEASGVLAEDGAPALVPPPPGHAPPAAAAAVV
ncbi:hypothetical protein ACKKBG_A08105 [Auxenochlorella protothecoides x Auxenochlorella symbiontica]